jgi:hypothetical protein
MNESNKNIMTHPVLQIKTLNIQTAIIPWNTERGFTVSYDYRKPSFLNLDYFSDNF